ncbi:MAG: ATP-binding cassette domain-containing protein, partial [Actinomycetes bacterium]
MDQPDPTSTLIAAGPHQGVPSEVPQGGVVAVLGSNGAGKTTLLRAVSGV